MTEFRVFGPPGTGKTTYLARQIAQAVDKYGAGDVMVASFTRAAAVELIARDLPVERGNVGTLHALCYRAMGAPPIAETKIKEFNESQSVYALSGDGIDLDEPEQHFDTEADRIFALYQVRRAQMLPRDQWEADVAAFAASWERWKETSGYVDFTDMIEESLQQGYVPEARIGFFDEVQDFTKLELSLVRRWGDHMESIVLAGDDDQAIYGFKGATPDAFLSPELPREQKRVLGESYRMPINVYMAAETWIGQLRGRSEDKPYTPRRAPGTVNYRPDLLYRGARTLVDEVDALVTSTPENDEGKPRTALIVAACSYQLSPIVSTLRERGVLFHNPWRRKRGDWNPIRASRGLSTAQRVLHLLADSPSTHGDGAHPWTYGDIAAFMPLVRKTGVFRRGTWQKLVDNQPPERPVGVATLQALFEDGVVDAIHHDPFGWLEDHVAADKARAVAYPLTVARMRGASALKETPRIIIGTIHSVKGGQADDVFILPDLSPAGNIEWHDERTRDNVVRQFYVGITRARETLTLCGASSPSAVKWTE